MERMYHNYPHTTDQQCPRRVDMQAQAPWGGTQMPTAPPPTAPAGPTPMDLDVMEARIAAMIMRAMVGAENGNPTLTIYPRPLYGDGTRIQR